MKQDSNEETASSLAPEKLYLQCEQKARVPDMETFDSALSLLAGVLTFQERLFEADSTLSAPSLNVPTAINKQQAVCYAKRYLQILDLLKLYKSRNARWILLALWLRDEGVCDPFEFLPKKMYQLVTREKRHELKKISISDLQHYFQVEGWVPYFERLLAERRAKRNLKRAGFPEKAIAVAQKNNRSAVAAACGWLATAGLEATTLRNAHSRVSKIMKTSQNF